MRKGEMAIFLLNLDVLKWAIYDIIKQFMYSFPITIVDNLLNVQAKVCNINYLYYLCKQFFRMYECFPHCMYVMCTIMENVKK